MPNKDMFDVLKYQEGGDHYKKMKVQPAYFINENKLPFAEGNAIKYICRHPYKGKEEDIKSNSLPKYDFRKRLLITNKRTL